jgi:hypothetical protein
MNTPLTRASGLAVIIICALTSGRLLAAAASPVSQVHEMDPAKVVGAQKCGECHKFEVEAWKLTPHFKTFADMHKSQDGLEISTKMGIKRIKSESLCLTCHYTVQKKASETEVISGVSCESCHGPAQDWLNLHNDKKLSRDQKRAKSQAAGMLRPDDVYSVASNCYQCHLVPNEKLVNVGGHSAGTPGFDLVAWSQGMVRHNFLLDDGTEGKVNKADSQNRLRMLFVMGKILDVEFSLRGVASATQKATYAVTMAHRVADARTQLAEIQKLAPTDEVKAISDIASSVSLKLNNGAELTAAADKVGELGRKFATAETGDKLAAVDPLIPKPDKYRGDGYKP